MSIHMRFKLIISILCALSINLAIADTNQESNAAAKSNVSSNKQQASEQEKSDQSKNTSKKDKRKKTKKTPVAAAQAMIATTVGQPGGSGNTVATSPGGGGSSSSDTSSGAVGEGEAGSSANVAISKNPMVFPLGDISEIRAWAKLRIPEFFYGQNLNLLNNNNPTDRVFFARHILDLNTEYHYFSTARDHDIIFAKINIRNKAVWGDPESIASTTISDVKLHNSVFGFHKHGIPRLFFWMRECWIQISLNEFLHLPLNSYHTLTFGSFPFQVGRGIALGASFKVDPTDLGYYAEVAVDQYAFGGKLSGVIYQDCLMYDIYAAFIDNRSVKFSQNNERIRGQQYGHRNYQARGFGVIDYIVAGRFKLNAFSGPCLKMTFEPYAVYNHNPEQKIEFLGDAVSDLVTVGVASETEIGNFEWGFDTAFNMGRQQVWGWDTNFIRIEQRNGIFTEVNAKVRQLPPGQPIPDCARDHRACKKIPLALDVPENQQIIEQSEQSSGQNCLVIGENSLGTLINDCTRFEDPYYNTFGGSMLVFDMAYNIKFCNLKVAAAYGFATGDKNPNRDHEKIGDSQIDGDYNGFLGLQETYSGTRVKSAFLLSGSGSIPRILGFSAESSSNPGASLVSRFTNIIFTGISCTWKPKNSKDKWSINPNILAYWQDVCPGIWDHKMQHLSQYRDANPFLGVEINLFVESEPIDGLKFFGVSAVYLPGTYYKDLKGRPLNRAQQAFINNQNITGIVNDWVPLLGDDPGYFANLGCEYKF